MLLLEPKYPSFAQLLIRLKLKLEQQAQPQLNLGFKIEMQGQ
jgi:hypothetical protein